MSLSHTPSQEHPKLPQLEVSAIPSVPALKTAPAEPQPTATDPQPTEATASPQTAEATTAPQPESPAPSAPAPRAKLARALDILLDTALVLSVIGVLGGGGYYLKTQWDKYRVPTIMEIAYAECEQLCSQREKLQDAYNHADEQLLMRNKVAALRDRIAAITKEAAALDTSIANHQTRILALQHEIRRANKDARNVAKGLLPGLPVGDVTTTRGRTYANATISRLYGKRISLRTPSGAASIPIDELQAGNLPDIVLYALGLIELVDTNDFTANGEAPPATTLPNPKLRPAPTRDTAHKSKRPDTSYEPAPTGPIVDTQSNRNAPGADNTPIPDFRRPASSNTWHAPTGDLPL